MNKQRDDKRHESELKFKSVNIFCSSGALKCFNGVKIVS